jgi:single-stranded-DNA-specific exonuclease
VHHCRFEIPDCPPSAVERLRRELGLSDALGQVLVRRGLAEPQQARAFLEGVEEHSPSAFRGIEEAVAVIAGHIRGATRITVHGDYDVDGICSAAVLVRALQALGADVDFYLPDRSSDGYGLNLRTVQRLAARGTRLLVTVDCAVTAVEEVAAARELGMDVVVTDHHAPRSDGVLPRASIVHPRLCGYPFAELCATAVAYKLAQALYTSAGRDPLELRQDLDLVALATIADVVPLIGENRALARAGLRTLASTTKPGLRALMAVAGVDVSRVDERAVGFALAPRLNAAGRLYRADAGLELILTSDPARAVQIAEELNSANHERRAVERQIRFQAEAQMAEQGERSAYVLAGEDWHPGVIGIVASRMVEQSGRPVVLIALDAETGRGSGRSVESFDLLAGLSACGQSLLRYGGHSAAAGLEIERGRILEFTAALRTHADLLLRAEDLVPVERVDAIVDGGDLGMTLAEELHALAPYGRGNPGVSLMLADAVFADSRPMGEGKHVRFTVRTPGARARAVAFGTGGRLPVQDGEPVRATFTLEVNEWNGVSEPRLVLRRASALNATPLKSESSIAAEHEPASEDLATAGGERAGEQGGLLGAGAEPVGEDGELVLFALP